MSGGGAFTVIGAGAGLALGGPMGAAAGAAIGSTVDQGIAGQNAADAQGKIAQAQLAQQQQTRAAATAAAAPSPSELASLQQQVSLNNQDISRKQQLLASADPALIEAGKQANQLLQGQESSVLNPLRTQIAQQRQQLQQKLQSQLGPGYATSSAGMQALAAFDAQSNSALAGAQQQSLSQLLGVTQNTENSASLNSNMNAMQNITGDYANQSNRMVSAINGTPITAAGAQFVGDLQSAKNAQQTTQNLLSTGTTLATLYGASGGFGSSNGQNFGLSASSGTDYNLNSGSGYLSSGGNSGSLAGTLGTYKY